MEGYSLTSGSTILVYFFSVLVKFKDVPEATSASGHHKASWISAIHHTSFLSLMMSPFISGTYYTGLWEFFLFARKHCF